MIKRFSFAIAALSITLVVGACSTPFGERIKQSFTAIETGSGLISSASAATVDSRAVLVAANTFDGLQALATQYLRLPRCPDSAPICREPAATRPLINATYAGRKARKDAVQYVKDHPCPKGQESCPLGASGAYEALQRAVATINDIYSNYNVAATVAAAKP